MNVYGRDPSLWIKLSLRLKSPDNLYLGFLTSTKCPRILGFKSCKYHSKSNNEECIFGCIARKRQKIKDDEPEQILNKERINITL